MTPSPKGPSWRTRVPQSSTLRVAVPALVLALVCATVAVMALRVDAPPVEDTAQAEAVTTTTGTVPAAVRATAIPATPPGWLELPARIPGHDRTERNDETRVAAPLGRYGLAAVAPDAGWTFHGAPADGSSPPSIPEEERRLVVPMPASALGFGWPVQGAITSIFSERHPLGIDIGPVDAEALVLAARDGVVMFSGGEPCCSYGYYVIIDHGDGVTSIYGHLREPSRVKVGEWLPRGTVLGIAGDTGHSFGVHLHFEVRVRGVPVDPESAITAGVLSPLLRPVSPDEVALDPGQAQNAERSTPSPDGGIAMPAPEAVIVPATPGAEATADLEPEQGQSPTVAAESMAGASTTTTAAATTPATTTPVATSPAATPTPQTAAGGTPAATPPRTSATTTATARPATVASGSGGTTTTATPKPATATPSRATTATPVAHGATATPAENTAASGPAATATPESCERVRGPVAGATPPGFVRLVATGEGVRSLLAERCAGKEQATLTVVTAAGHVCTAAFTLGGVPGTDLTFAGREPVGGAAMRGEGAGKPGDDQPAGGERPAVQTAPGAGEVHHRWTFAPGVTAGASITVACAASPASEAAIPATVAALPASGGSDTIATPAGR